MTIELPAAVSRSRAAARLALLVAVSLLSPACSDSDGVATGAAKSGAAPSAPLTDAPIAEPRAALIELAFDAVTRMPVLPHIKDRSRAQEAVVETCLELGQPARAARYVESIGNWRRGTAYGELAFYCAERGATAQSQEYLELARQVAEAPDDSIPDVESPQSWRRDRIRAKIAKTWLRLGLPEEAARFEADLAAPERGEVEAVRALSVDESACVRLTDAIEQLGPSSGFEEIQGALQTAVELHGRFYSNDELRSRLEAAVDQASRYIPRQARIGLLLELAGHAVEQQDAARAAELLQAARTTLDEAQWDLDDYTPLATRVAILRYESGDVDGARRDVESARARFEQRRAELNSIRLARAIRPLAEACAALQSPADALALYGQAVELGAENPNARPRAEELAATCCSMAERDVQPGPELWTRMQQIGAALDAPW